MESYPNSSVPGGGVLSPEHLPFPVFTATACSTLLHEPNADSLSEIFLDQYTEVDLSSEWLSSFVEECLSSAGNCFPLPKVERNLTTTTTANNTTTTTNPNPSKPQRNNIKSHKKTPATHRNSGVPGKPRSQRKRRITTTINPSPRTHKNPMIRWPDHLNPDIQPLHLGFSDPPLLEQAYWLADSELILPRKEERKESKAKEGGGEDEEMKTKKMGKKKGRGGGEEVEEMGKDNNGGGEQQPRKCNHCQAQKTPQWRAGPMGPKTLCNACGVRYFKSGRLLPEYRPAKSPTFVSYKHSNSHKKVLQMRMALLSSSSPNPNPNLL